MNTKNNEPKKVLVTGATGFLGTWLVKSLVQAGHDVRILKRPQTELDIELKKLNLETAPGDITDSASLLSATIGIDTVFHLAGLIAYTKTKYDLMYKVNVFGTQNVIDACLANKVRRLVYLSSIVSLGASFDGRRPLTEKSEYNLKSLHLGYFETKNQAEQLVLNAHRERGLDVVILNPTTIYGEGDAKKGSRSNQIKVARGEMPFYPTGGVNIVAVEDVIEALLTAWKIGRSGERYILGGENLLIKDVFEMIAAVAGVEPPKIPLNRTTLRALGLIGDQLERRGKKFVANSEIAWSSTLFNWADNSKARRELGFNPRPARQAIEASVNWMRTHGLLKK